ncbi:hypothetical protein [Sinimarinibacterium sp. NLF-5-8]|uniref:hypothetical protein n=1 Tax=Sinimarinibacterium sp. NLF-5-8 TaxID=2698684 RepID=UPI00137BBDAB|nr:hypothetical protein [Sinimarinibacterium sp. NLF-5-8]QHS09400.1 hypothetical protein GT972_03995 [Sinimarinibacterium sp. NLF-5-8]
MSNSRILKNTLALYTRQIIIIFITLYSLRVVLNELGTDDYGVYSVITGFVTLLAFLPGSMASATQRFFSFAMCLEVFSTLLPAVALEQYSSEKAKQALVGINEKFANRNYT